MDISSLIFPSLESFQSRHQCAQTVIIFFYTSAIRQQPHNPNTWLARATVFLKLGYLELAVGDAFKAILLLEDGRFQPWQHLQDKDQDSLLEEHKIICLIKWRYVKNTARVLLLTTLTKMYAYNDAYKFCHTVKEQKALETHGIANMTKRPRVTIPAYPWMQHRHKTRQPKAIQKVQQELTPFSLSLRPCSFMQTPEILGIYGEKDFEKGELIMLDVQITAQKSLAKNAAAIDSTHEDEDDDDDDNQALNLYILTETVLSNMHPLDHDLLTRFSHSPRDRKTRFSFSSFIASPIRHLQSLGVDIWTNLKYDTWVLLTAFARIDDNAWASTHHNSSDDAVVSVRGENRKDDDDCERTDAVCSDKKRENPIEGVGPLFSFFNHSCDANATWVEVADASIIQVTACREIKLGEEIFIAYLPVRDLELKERRFNLRPWFDGDCCCERCQREDQETDELARYRVRGRVVD